MGQHAINSVTRGDPATQATPNDLISGNISSNSHPLSKSNNCINGSSRVASSNGNSGSSSSSGNSPTVSRSRTVSGSRSASYQIPCKKAAAAGSFQARDNVCNFITWCRSLGIRECLLFETEDLVLGKNEKSFVLCLLEVARKGSLLGMRIPLLVQLEQEIDQELEQENEADHLDAGPQSLTRIPVAKSRVQGTRSRVRGGVSEEEEGEEEADAAGGTPGSQEQNDSQYNSETDSDSSSTFTLPQPQIVTNDLKSLHEHVVDLLNRCTCPSQYPMIKVSDGKYRIGDTKTLIFVRILRRHVMVRVGGGWDTLEHYLDKHDPCRCYYAFAGGRRRSSAAGLNSSFKNGVRV